MKRKPRPIAIPSIIGRSVRFATIEAILDQLERGEVTVATIAGREFVAYRDLTDGAYHELVPALDGWCDWVELLAARLGTTVPVKAHKRMMADLIDDRDIDLSNLRAVRAEMAQHQALYLQASPELRASTARTCQLKFRLS